MTLSLRLVDRKLPCLILALALAQGVIAGTDSWETTRSEDAESTASSDRASVSSSDGYRLALFRDAQGTLRGRLQIQRGLDQFSSFGCATLRVDKRAPINLHDSYYHCVSDNDNVEFRLGDIDGNTIASLILTQLINGSRLEVSFTLKGVGYRQTTFTLSGSKQAVAQLLGSGVQVKSADK